MKNLPIDKKLHAIVGSYIGLITYLIIKDLGGIQDLYVGASVVLVFLAGVGKELYDKISKKGTPDRKDAAYTIYAGWASILLYHGFTILKQWIF